MGSGIPLEDTSFVLRALACSLVLTGCEPVPTSAPPDATAPESPSVTPKDSPAGPGEAAPPNPKADEPATASAASEPETGPLAAPERPADALAPETRVQDWAAAFAPECAQELIEMDGSEVEDGAELWAAWVFEGTDPDEAECAFDGAAVVASPEGLVQTHLTCVDGVMGGDLEHDGRGELVILEVECAGGGGGELYPQFWADRPDGPVELSLALGKNPGGVVGVEWRSQRADNDTLVVIVSDDAGDWERDEEDDREIRLRIEGDRLVPAP